FFSKPAVFFPKPAAFFSEAARVFFQTPPPFFEKLCSFRIALEKHKSHEEAKSAQILISA
ncbi:hypothetical protein HMPREF1981_01434, partial [Bacteroides pyogenes F0041]